MLGYGTERPVRFADKINESNLSLIGMRNFRTKRGLYVSK